jgi:hypothetical protein
VIAMSLRLEDIELIRQLKYRYCRAIDTCDIDALRQIVTEDIRTDYAGGTYRWQMQGREVFLEAIRGSFTSDCIAVHTVHHPEIEVLDDVNARGLWYLTDTFIHLRENVVTEGSALYRDEYLKTPDGWRIRFSTYERIYERVERLTTAPNITAHRLAGKLPNRSSWPH